MPMVFDEIRKNMIHDHGSRYNGVRNKSCVDRLQSCCHHSLRDWCVLTDDASWKLKQYWTHEDIGNYLGGCIIGLKLFSTGCVYWWRSQQLSSR